TVPLRQCWLTTGVPLRQPTASLLPYPALFRSPGPPLQRVPAGAVERVVPRAGVAPRGCQLGERRGREGQPDRAGQLGGLSGRHLDRKSTRLDSSHVKISYTVLGLHKTGDAGQT